MDSRFTFALKLGILANGAKPKRQCSRHSHCLSLYVLLIKTATKKKKKRESLGLRNSEEKTEKLWDLPLSWIPPFPMAKPPLVPFLILQYQVHEDKIIVKI